MPARAGGHGRERTAGVLVIDQHGAGQAGVVAAHVAPPRNDAGYYAGTVADAVLGGGYSARLNEEIRIKRGLSYGAGSDLDTRRNAGVWLASAQTKNPSAPQVVELMLGEFERLGSTPVSADELAARKATLIGGYGRSLETTAGLAGQVGDLAVHDVDLGEVGRFIERVQAVTPAQIQDYARAHLDAGDMHVVVAGDAAQFADALRAKRPDCEGCCRPTRSTSTASRCSRHRQRSDCMASARAQRAECPLWSYSRCANRSGRISSTNARACGDRYLPLRTTTP